MKRIAQKMNHVKERIFSPKSDQQHRSSTQPKPDKYWLDLQFNDTKKTTIKRPDQLENEMEDPPINMEENMLDLIQGSMVGMALGDALGAHVEFRPYQYMVENPVTDLGEGGTWGLEKGQFTDDTSMALCLANSLVVQSGFSPYDQLVRYKWWYRNGYMSSTGECFDIGAATSDSLNEFEYRQNKFASKYKISEKKMDQQSEVIPLEKFNVYCSSENVAGNGALMRLAPVPLFFHRYPVEAVEYSGRSGQITHGDVKAYDACRYYGALIIAALKGYSREELLSNEFYSKHKQWFGEKPLCHEIKRIAEGSYKKKGGYQDGIRGKGYIVNALEAALWAFWSDGDSFERGALSAVNLGDDTDTTAAIYGQLAGAYYGYRNLPQKWLKHVYAKKFILNLSKWILYEGDKWQPTGVSTPRIYTSQPDIAASNTPEVEPKLVKHSAKRRGRELQNNSPQYPAAVPPETIQHGPALRGTLSMSSVGGSIPTSSSAVNPRSVNHIQTNSHSTSQPESDGTATNRSEEKPRVNIHSSSYEEDGLSSNVPQHHESISSDGYHRGPALRITHSMSTAKESTPSTALNQALFNHHTTISYLPTQSQPGEKITTSSKKKSSKKYSPENPVPIHSSDVTPTNDTISSRNDRSTLAIDTSRSKSSKREATRSSTESPFQALAAHDNIASQVYSTQGTDMNTNLSPIPEPIMTKQLGPARTLMLLPKTEQQSEASSSKRSSSRPKKHGSGPQNPEKTSHRKDSRK